MKTRSDTTSTTYPPADAVFSCGQQLGGHCRALVPPCCCEGTVGGDWLSCELRPRGHDRVPLGPPYRKAVVRERWEESTSAVAIVKM